MLSFLRLHFSSILICIFSLLSLSVKVNILLCSKHREPVRCGSKIQELWPRAFSWPDDLQFLLSSHLTGAVSNSHRAKICKKQDPPLHYEFNGSWEPRAVASVIRQFCLLKSRITSSKSRSLWKANKTLAKVILITRGPLKVAQCNPSLSELKISYFY